jgi:hypothetical protein
LVNSIIVTPLTNIKIPTISLILIFSLKKYFEDKKLKNISICPKALTKDA